MVTEMGDQELGVDGAGARFFEEIARSGLLPLHASAYDAASAVLCTLSQRVTG